jgi:hypothetical protein
VFAPIPNAIVMTVTVVKPGDLASVRKAKRKSLAKSSRKRPALAARTSPSSSSACRRASNSERPSLLFSSVKSSTEDWNSSLNASSTLRLPKRFRIELKIRVAMMHPFRLQADSTAAVMILTTWFQSRSSTLSCARPDAVNR